MAAHGLRRARPAELLAGTLRVLSVRMDYLSADTPDDWREHDAQRLSDAGAAIISRYAWGRDYHKVLRQRLQRLAQRMQQAAGALGYRVFVDSGPLLEAELARRAGLGWRGKHTLLISRTGGSMAFLGEILVDWPLPIGEPQAAHCGRCTACIDVCPTQAIVAAHQLDARRCISYLTLEHAGPIPIELRASMGQHIAGCDDCQRVCPWNKWAQRSPLPDFAARAPWPQARLLDLFAWDDAAFLQHTEGSALRRIGPTRWLRNLAVALGNALRSPLSPAQRAAIVDALAARREHPQALVREHVAWALAQTQQP